LHLTRRTFVSLLGSATAAAVLPPPLLVPAPDSYWCDCNLVQYFRQPEGHFAATHFNGQRLSFVLHCEHLHLHRKSRLWMLVEIGRRYRPLSSAEKSEIQILFTRVGLNDLRVLRAERS
jgi:hypothetical protein